MDFYSVSGYHKDGNAIPTLESVRESERIHPNSTRDAARMIGTARALLGGDRPRPRMLDVGCGFGFFSLEAQRLSFDVTPIELASEDRTVAHEMLGVLPLDVPFEEFQAPVESFDVILMSQILEHARDVDQWIARTVELLAPGGVLAIALPNFNSIFRQILQEKDPYVCPPAHLNYFAARSLSSLLRRHGLTTVRTQWISRFPRTSIEKRVGFLGKLGVSATHLALTSALKVADRAHAGMILNMYATR